MGEHLELLASWLAAVLQWLNPLSVRQLPANSFMGFVGLGIAMIGGGFMYPAIRNLLKDDGKALLVTILIGIVIGSSAFRVGKDSQSTCEAFCFVTGGVFRFGEGVSLIVGSLLLLRGESLRGRTLDRALLIHPVVLIFAALQLVFYLAELEKRDYPASGLIWAVLSLVAAAISYAGVVSLILSFCRDASVDLPAPAIASGFCVLFLLTSIYTPETTAHHLFFLLGFPAGVTCGIVASIQSRH